jgi:hypothetical protein
MCHQGAGEIARNDEGSSRFFVNSLVKARRIGDLNPGWCCHQTALAALILLVPISSTWTNRIAGLSGTGSDGAGLQLELQLGTRLSWAE